MPRNLLLNSDGTNNSPTHPPTNVYLLHKLTTDTTPTQTSLYDPGVGTAPLPSARTPIGKLLTRWAGLGLGTGLEDNVLDLYRNLIHHYDTDTDVYLFGFSRGAYTVRVLAGLLHLAGLLRPEHADQAPNVLRAYRELFHRRDWTNVADGRAADIVYGGLRRDLSRPCPIHFMGLFDTVSSVGWIWNPKTFPNTYRLPSVRHIRHAIALDERRAKFRTNRVSPEGAQDLQERWFAGVHSDVGGGYPDGENALSRVPLRWMIEEAKAVGMQVNPVVEAQLKLHVQDPEEIQAPQHESLRGPWWLIEYIPQMHRTQVDGVWRTGLRLYLGRGWRSRQEDDVMHESIQRRSTPVRNPSWKRSLPVENTASGASGPY